MPSESPTPVYFIAQLHAPDIDRYRHEYGRRVLAQVAEIGGKLLIASPSPTVLEGDYAATWTAVIEFPDRATALRWYDSPDYAPLKTLRLTELTTEGTAALFDGYPMPAGDA